MDKLCLFVWDEDVKPLALQISRLPDEKNLERYGWADWQAVEVLQIAPINELNAFVLVLAKCIPKRKGKK